MKLNFFFKEQLSLVFSWYIPGIFDTGMSKLEPVILGGRISVHPFHSWTNIAIRNITELQKDSLASHQNLT